MPTVYGPNVFNMSSSYPLGLRHSYQSYSFYFGFADRLASFFSPHSKMQNCNRLLEKVEEKLVRIQENYMGRYVNSEEENYYNYMIQQGELWADILRQVHPFTFNCIYGLNQDLWESNVKIIYAKSVLYILDFWLENDEFIFQDMIQIYNLTFDAVFNGQLYLLFDYELLFGAILLLRANLP